MWHFSKSPELYQAATLKRIRAGADVTMSAYMQSRRQLDQMRHSASRIFETIDLVITPTAPVPPFAIADLTDPDTARPKELQMLHNTRPIHGLGLPTISVPCGFTAEGLPIGMQISGPPGAEATVLRLAYASSKPPNGTSASQPPIPISADSVRSQCLTVRLWRPKCGPLFRVNPTDQG